MLNKLRYESQHMLSKTIVHHNTIQKKNDLGKKTLVFQHTTPITVIRIIAAKNENDPPERGLISGCLV
jgi:hypothetical protein